MQADPCPETMTAELFGVAKALVGMIHVQALPGTPCASQPVSAIVEQARREAALLTEHGFDGIIIENMHDRPYVRGEEIGPEITASMAAVLDVVRGETDLPVGVQILAAGNRQALAVAAMGGAAFIRAENFVFAHVADEGLMADAEAGALLRYRRELDAEHVRIFADVKKKHASHALTSDVSLVEAARAAELFGADGLIVTGTSTGEPVRDADVREVASSVALPIAIGSGLTPNNLAAVWEWASIFIVGSFLKEDGVWHNPPDPDRLRLMVESAKRLRASD